MLARAALRHAPGRPTIGDGFAAIAGGDPIAPGLRQKFQVLRVVDAQQRRRAEACRGDDPAESLRLDAFEHDLRALRGLVRTHQFAAIEFGARAAQYMIRRENSDHSVVLIGAGAQRLRCKSTASQPRAKFSAQLMLGPLPTRLAEVRRGQARVDCGKTGGGHYGSGHAARGCAAHCAHGGRSDVVRGRHWPRNQPGCGPHGAIAARGQQPGLRPPRQDRHHQPRNHGARRSAGAGSDGRTHRDPQLRRHRQRTGHDGVLLAPQRAMRSGRRPDRRPPRARPRRYFHSSPVCCTTSANWCCSIVLRRWSGRLSSCRSIRPTIAACSSASAKSSVSITVPSGLRWRAIGPCRARCRNASNFTTSRSARRHHALEVATVHVANSVAVLAEIGSFDLADAPPISAAALRAVNLDADGVREIALQTQKSAADMLPLLVAA